MGQILRSTERILVIVNTKMSIVAVCDYSIDCLAYSDERLLVRVAGLFVPSLDISYLLWKKGFCLEGWST